ncbi:MAG: hypothetical protein ACTHJR_11000 [Sphingomonas sp.]|uniref:hypothetical protein n=1 Tax=Sphingomonas sp. TaxID=28214 RepID=UPI003F816B15
MSAARTARRRRRQAALGTAGLEQVYGKRHCPHYPAKMTREKSARLLAKRLQTEQRIRQGKRK